MDSIFTKLSGELDRCGITTDILAEKLNTSKHIINQKLKGELPWELWEALVICKLLGTSDIESLFVQFDNN